MSIFDFQTSFQSKSLLFKCTSSSIENELSQSSLLFSGVLAMKTPSGQFKAKMVKIINKKLIFYSVNFFFFKVLLSFSIAKDPTSDEIFGF